MYLFGWRVRRGGGGAVPYPEKSRVIIRDKGTATTGTLTITNPSSHPWMMQAWLENENGIREGNVYPELSRLEVNSSRRLLINPVHSQWNKGREGLNWLVVRLIPSTKRGEQSRLSIPLVLRLKVFLRSGTTGQGQELPRLSCLWSQDSNLILRNDGQHYLTLTKFKDSYDRTVGKMPLMITPEGQQIIGQSMMSGRYKYSYVNDQGIIDNGSVICR